MAYVGTRASIRLLKAERSAELVGKQVEFYKNELAALLGVPYESITCPTSLYDVAEPEEPPTFVSPNVRGDNSKYRKDYRAEVERYYQGKDTPDCCEICGKRGIKLVFDHDHKTGLFRG